MYTVPIPENKINQDMRERIGEAIYLLAYFIHRADWKKGALRTTHSKISDETGFPVTTIRRWLDALIRAGEIRTRRLPNGVVVFLTDYQAIARTRRVNYTPASLPNDNPNMSDRSNMAESDSPEVSNQDAGNGLSDCSDLDKRLSGTGLSNINRLWSDVGETII